MDNYKFDFNRIWVTRNEAGDSLSLSAFNGRISLVLFKKGSGKPDVKVAAPIPFLLRWKSILKELITANPGTKVPFVVMKYDPNTKQSTKDVNIIFAKDEKNCYYIEMQTARVAPVRFNLRGSGMYSDGSNPMTDEGRSLIGLQELTYVLQNEIPLARMLSTYTSGAPSNFKGGNAPKPGNDFKKQAPSSDPFNDTADIF